MLAARMYGIDDIRVEEVPTPEITDGEILLKVKAAAICGTDVRMVSNGYKGISEDSPRILGHEFSGVVEKCGKNVVGYKVGDRVAVAPNMGCGTCADCVYGNGHLCHEYKALGINMDGGFAEYVRIPEAAVRGGNVSFIEENVSFEEAAINEALSCVCNGFERCDIRPGDDVVVIGAGPIGIMHAKLAKMAGAGRVFISDLSEERLAVCKQLEPSFITVSTDIKAYIQEASKGRGVDVCIVACPSPVAQQSALEICGNNARVMFFGGVPASKQPVGLDTNLIHYKQLIVTGTTRASITQYRKTLKFISTGVLDVKALITQRLPLSQIDVALDKAKRSEGFKNVIVFD